MALLILFMLGAAWGATIATASYLHYQGRLPLEGTSITISGEGIKPITLNGEKLSNVALAAKK